MRVTPGPWQARSQGSAHRKRRCLQRDQADRWIHASNNVSARPCKVLVAASDDDGSTLASYEYSEIQPMEALSMTQPSLDDSQLVTSE
eukprot:309837-Hanusia_phi.AAC.1